MGCISSKAIARSMSIREELHSRSAALEELLNSHSGNDQLFAFVRSTNSMTKFRSRSRSRSTDLQAPPQTKYLANAWDLLPEHIGETESTSATDTVEQSDFLRLTRSKSCQIIREKENKLDWEDKNITGSRSFHTVEEYDALLERIKKFSSEESFQDFHSWEDVGLQESKFLNENLMESGQGSSSMSNFENVIRVDGMHETGWKRKAVAKGLKSLDMSTIEFPAIGRFRQRVHADGQVYSPGSYITPKFGSYNGKMAPAVKEKEGGESSLFSPELVAAFEDCMQQLQEEEDSILSHMDEYEEMENRLEEVPTNMQVDVRDN